MPAAPIRIRRLSRVTEDDVRSLADVLVDCVEGGASVSFMLPLTHARAAAFWRGLGPDVAAGARILLAAEDEAGIVGTAQLVVAQPENQPHRADLAKMLVHRRARGRGVGAALLEAAEEAAVAAGKSLIVLDTATGSDAERLYRRHGWIAAGTVPGFAHWPAGGLCATTFYYRALGRPTER